jgi:hypothetical protein
MDVEPAVWRKSSMSGDSGDCVEWRFVADSVHLRDSKDPDGPQLSFTRREWIAFVAGVRAGEADPG